MKTSTIDPEFWIGYSLPYVAYGNTGTKAYYDCETDTYYNSFGDELRDPSEYDTDTEGYTPFGDE